MRWHGECRLALVEPVGGESGLAGIESSLVTPD